MSWVPNTRTEALSGRTVPEMTFISVDLPAPLGPISPTISPLPTWIDAPFRACTPPKATVAPSTCNGTSR